MVKNKNIDFNYALKIYNSTSFEEYSISKKQNDTSSYHFEQSTSNFKVLHPTFAVVWKTKNNNFNEIELTNFLLNKIEKNIKVVNDSIGNKQELSDYKANTTNISFSYEYILNFNKSKDKKYLISLGLGINPFYIKEKYIPVTSSSFQSSEQYFGAKIFIAPRFLYFINSKIFVDINTPLYFSNTYCIIDKDENPSLSVEKRTTSSLNFQEFPKIFNGRIGIGIKL